MQYFLDFMGRLHPLIVHLPIGFILLALLLEFSKSKFKEADKVLRFIMLWVILSGSFSLLSGYLQYTQEGYLWKTVERHFYLGIITLLLSLGFFIFLRNRTFLNRLPRIFFPISLLVSVIITGHLGGNITHGEDHLTAPLAAFSSDFLEDKSKAKEFSLNERNFKEQPLYSAVVAPILTKKCVSCHNTKRTKGGLQMHTFEAILKGGKNGAVVNFDNPELSELLVRIHLPLTEKKHMPPKSKKQLTKAEIRLINYWIEVGAPEKQTLGQLGIKRELITPFLKKEEVKFYPDLGLDTPDPEIIQSIASKGLIISPVKRGANLLTISTLNLPEFNTTQLEELLVIREHLVSIDLSYSAVDDSVFEVLSQFPNLVQIKLNQTQITGKDLHLLSRLVYLKKLYMVETALLGETLTALQEFPSIEQVFVFQPDRNIIEEVELSLDLQAIIEFGEALLPLLPNEKESD